MTRHKQFLEVERLRFRAIALWARFQREYLDGIRDGFLPDNPAMMPAWQEAERATNAYTHKAYLFFIMYNRGPVFLG